MKSQDKEKKHRCFHAELLPEVAARGFDRQRKARTRRLSWAEWAREPQLRLSAN